jgi:hypothetical protein
MSERQTKSITVLSANSYDEDKWPGELASNFLTWLVNTLALVPKEYEGIAVIKLDSEYDSRCISISVEYERPETDDEVNERENSRIKWELQKELRDRSTLKLLIDKYGVPK